ncbi:MAG: restriction endonuclease subunit S [Muribaculaceae bacterium]|nr:restriction endonuclease subunit S [Muribaculaceae bacterium]
MFVTGAVVPKLTQKNLVSIQVPLPPEVTQQRIIHELDKLNELIEIKRKQLKDLDSLAKSLFYETFGDPVENPKGWEIKPLSSVAPQQQYEGDILDNNGQFWLLNLDMIEKNTGKIINYVYLNENEIGNSVYKIGPGQVLYSKLRPNLNKVVISNYSGYCTSELLPLNPKDGVLNSVFLSNLLRLPECVSVFSGKVAGAKMPRVDLKIFRNFPLILPPLPLQTEFATKIESIERQKSRIESTISDLETLLASRMDYWFND